MRKTVSAMPKTSQGAATIRSLQVICAVPCCQWCARYQCTRRACLAGEGAMVTAWSPRGLIRRWRNGGEAGE
jgi:hypothetical protein